MSTKKTKCTVAQKLEHDEILKMVTDLLMDKHKAELWMRLPNRNFGGSSPKDLILRDRGEKVRVMVEQAKMGQGIRDEQISNKRDN